MFRPPLDPRDSRAVNEPTWRSVLVTYTLAAAIPLLLWAASQPLAGVVVLTAIAGLFIGARHAVTLVRCLYDCRGFAFDLGGKVRITVTQTPIDDPN